jgi:hypothetical protein
MADCAKLDASKNLVILAAFCFSLRHGSGGESMRGQPGFFDVDERLRRLSDLGDQLLAFTAAVDFEIFRSDLLQALAYLDGSQGGRRSTPC